MGTTRGRGAVLAIVVAMLCVGDAPATAGSTTTADPSGVDFDAACLTRATPAVQNLVPSPAPGPRPWGYCDVPPDATVYDGSTEATDLADPITAVKLESNAAGQFVATMKVDGEIPAPGPGPAPGAAGSLDLPAANFLGATYFVLFQNKSFQTNVPKIACPALGGGPRAVFDQHGSWKDGYHFFVAYDVRWNGLQWVHTASIGEYDPKPDGAFFSHELGWSNGAWTDAEPALMVRGANWNSAVATGPGGPSTITVTVDGVVKHTDVLNCATGVFNTHYAVAGDVIANMKGLTAAHDAQEVELSVPLSRLCGLTDGLECDPEEKVTGTYLWFSDTTDGGSPRPPVGAAYSPGLLPWLDTLGDGPTCPRPTFGGLLPQNPLFVPDTACLIDDDTIARGLLFAEWWETTHGFPF